MSKNIQVIYTKSAKKDLEKIDNTFARKIVLKIEEYTRGNPLKNSKALTGAFSGLYRYRIGDYRAIFEYDSENNVITIYILVIKHRKEIYRRI